eukprot:g52170.t1
MRLTQRSLCLPLDLPLETRFRPCFFVMGCELSTAEVEVESQQKLSSPKIPDVSQSKDVLLWHVWSEEERAAVKMIKRAWRKHLLRQNWRLLVTMLLHGKQKRESTRRHSCRRTSTSRVGRRRHSNSCQDTQTPGRKLARVKTCLKKGVSTRSHTKSVCFSSTVSIIDPELLAFAKRGFDHVICSQAQHRPKSRRTSVNGNNLHELYISARAGVHMEMAEILCIMTQYVKLHHYCWANRITSKITFSCQTSDQDSILWQCDSLFGTSCMTVMSTLTKLWKMKYLWQCCICCGIQNVESLNSLNFGQYNAGIL